MNKILLFILGAAAGSLVTWKFVEEKYKKLADEEIESVIEHFNNKNNTETSPSLVHYEEIKECGKAIMDGLNEGLDVKEEHKEQVKILGYNPEDDEYVVETPPLEEYIPPYVISPEEFGEFGNTIKSLTYYEDGVLADEDDEIISDPESIVGDALQHFGEYEDDAVHVRDEKNECDYEILKSEKTFSEVYKEEN